VANRASMAAYIYAKEGIDLTATTALLTVLKRTKRVPA
jgi:hypothetical protein